MYTQKITREGKAAKIFMRLDNAPSSYFKWRLFRERSDRGAIEGVCGTLEAFLVPLCHK